MNLCDACKRKDAHIPVTQNGKYYRLCLKCAARLLASRSARLPENRYTYSGK